jgi:hypothetical protein
MAQTPNPYRRSIDPENDGIVLWVIVSALLLIMLVCGFLFGLSDHSKKYTAQPMKNSNTSDASRQS